MNAFESAIKNALDNRAKSNELLANNYPNNPDKKTIADCCKWITDEARKHKCGSCAIISDEDVFNMATSYFVEPGIKKYGGDAKASVAQSNEPAKVDADKLQKALDKATVEIHKQTDPKIGSVTPKPLAEPKKIAPLVAIKKLEIPKKVKKGSKRYNELIEEQLQTTLF